MSQLDGDSDHAAFLARLRKGSVSPADKRRYLKAIGEGFKRSDATALSHSVMPIIEVLANDEKWEVRQDVAELLLYAPEENFAQLVSKLTNDPNGYVRRSAERSQERRRKTERGAKRASRGIEQVTEQYERLTRQVGGEIADDAIRLSEARFTVLANALVHDLLNILTPMKSQARGLVKSLSDDHMALELAVKLSEGLDFMERSVRDAETYAQALPHERHPEWLNEVIRQATEMARRNLEDQGFDLAPVSLDDEGVSQIRVDMSRQLIVQALTNILTNAYEAFADQDGKLADGKISISTRTTDADVLIEIRDNGCGLAPDELTALLAFMPGRKNRSKRRSTGYGLLIANKNVQAHDGHLRVESSLGEGTVVKLSMPLKIEEAPNGQSAGC